MDTKTNNENNTKNKSNSDIKNTTIKNNKLINFIQGFVLSWMHWFIVTGLSVLGIFTRDWFTLLMVTGTLVIILFMNIFLHNCPLSEMEKDKMGTDMVSAFNSYAPISYSENRQYSVQLQYIVILISIINMKGIAWLFKKNLKDFILQLDEITDF